VKFCINPPSKVFVARRGEPDLTTTILAAGRVRDRVEQMRKAVSRRVDLSSLLVNASLPGRECLHVVIPDVTRRDWAVDMRRYVAREAPRRPRRARLDTDPCGGVPRRRGERRA